MRRSCLSGVFALGGLIVSWSVTASQEKAVGSRQAGQAVAQPMQQMIERLELTDRQSEQLNGIIQDQNRRCEEILQDVHRTRARNQQKRKALEEEIQRLGQDGAEILNAREQIRMRQNELRDKLRAILTPRQQEQWSRIAETGPDVIVNSIGMKLKRIPAGSFMMGSENNDANRYQQPVHKVTLTKPFYMGVYEVTQREWREIMGKMASGVKDDSYPVGGCVGLSGEQNASWFAAQEFCVRLSIREGVLYRLPTEAEWEYSCRAGSTTYYYWGEQYDPAYCWTSDGTGPKKGPIEVGQKKPNAWGLYDMCGNVDEWCEDTFEAGYPAGDQVDPLLVLTDRFGNRQGEPVLRGGMWWSGTERCCSVKRGCRPPESGFGFRIVRSAE